MRIYIVTHKEFNPPELEGYIPIQVGKCFTKKELGYVSDDSDENISIKNNTYCELTALYWIWKHDDSDAVGLCHYRRYFTINPFSRKKKYYLTITKANEILQSYDIILPQKIYLKNTVEEKYCLSGTGFIKDLDNTRRIIKDKFPEYVEAFNDIFIGKEQYFWNMFIMKKELLDEYCEWLFAVMAELEMVTDLSDYDNRQKRIYGYIAERLINVWVKKKGLKIYECPVVQSDRASCQIIKTNLGIMLKWCKK